MAASSYNQAPAQEQDSAQLAQLHERMMEAPLRSYNQPSAEVYQSSKLNQVDGLRLPLRSGEYMFGIGAMRYWKSDDPQYLDEPAHATMTWERPDSPDRLEFGTWKDQDSGDIRSRVLIRRNVGGVVKAEEVTDPLIIAAVTDRVYASLDALDQLAAPAASGF